MNLKPVIGVPADRRVLDPHPFHVVGEKYISALRDGSDALPLRSTMATNAPHAENRAILAKGRWTPSSDHSLHGGHAGCVGYHTRERVTAWAAPQLMKKEG